MIKPIFLLAAFMLLGNSLFAQHTGRMNARLALHNNVLHGLLQQQASNHSIAERTTGGVTMERVIAQSTHDSTGLIDDTVNLKYNLYRTSTYDYNTMIYPYNYPYNTSPMFNYAGTFTKPQVQFDTFNHWTIDPNTYIYGYYETAYAGYDANYNINSYFDIFADSAINPNMHYANKFNAAKNIDTGYWFTWASGVADSAFKQFFTYNSSNKLIADSTYELHDGIWRLASRSNYTYDASNNLIQINNYANDTDTSFTLPLIEQVQYINTYDVSNRLATVYSMFFDGTSLSPYIRDTFAYSGARTFHNSWKEYQYDPINMYWAPIFNMTKIANTLGFPDTVNIEGYDSLLISWVPQTMDVISYNVFHDPDTLKEYDYNFANFPSNPSFKTVYYYDSFISRVGVQNIVTIADETKVYPNPATDMITISQLGAVQNAMVSIALLNEQGQMVRRERMYWQNETQVSLGGLIPGVYWLEILDATGNMLHRQTVVKQ